MGTRAFTMAIQSSQFCDLLASYELMVRGIYVYSNDRDSCVRHDVELDGR